MLVLTVIHPFDDYLRGVRIEDSAKVEEILAGEYAHHCVKSNVEASEHHED